MTNWIFVISNEKQHFLANLRLVAGLKIAYFQDEIWLQLSGNDLQPPKVMLGIQPHKILIERDELLFSIGKKTPTQQLPELLWQPIQQVVAVEVPTSALPAQANKQLEIKLQASSQPHEAVALKLDWDVWRKYVEQAAAVRLKVLEFALSDQAEVMVKGKPLPALPGQAFWQAGRLLLPVGWELEWQAFATSIAEAISDHKDELILIEAEGNIRKIPKSALQPVSRSAVRRSSP